ncbi:hypothetical protein [Pseudoxanthomonas mexicana]
MSRMRLGIILALALVASSLAGWFRPLPTLDAATGREQQVAWQLPSPEALERSSAALSSQARTLKWMGDATSGGATSPQDWTLKAILNGESAILIQSGKEALISRAEVGATLPDGSRLLALKGDIAVVELDGCRMDRHLYPRASNPDSTECNVATLQKDTQQP